MAGLRERELKLTKTVVDNNISQSVNSFTEIDWLNEIKDINDLISEKRNTIKISAYIRLIRLLQKAYNLELINLYKDNILEQLMKSLASNDTDEIQYALKIIDLLAITYGKNTENSLNLIVFPLLSSLIFKRQSHRIRSYALRTMSIILYLSNVSLFSAASYYHHILCLLTLPSSSELPLALPLDTPEFVPHASLGGGGAKTEEENDNEETLSLAIAACINGWNLIVSKIDERDLEPLEYMEERYIYYKLIIFILLDLLTYLDPLLSQ